MSVLVLLKTIEDKSMKHAIGGWMVALKKLVSVLGLGKKQTVVRAESVLGIVTLANHGFVDAQSMQKQECVLATALVRAAKFKLVLIEQSATGIVFLADVGTPALSCRQLMMFFTELQNDLEKQGLQLRFGMTRGHELASASRMGSFGAPGEVVINRSLLNEAPVVKMKSRVIGQMRFASI